MQTSRINARPVAASRSTNVRVSALFKSKPATASESKTTKQTTKGKTTKVSKKEEPKQPERKQAFLSGVVDALDFARPTQKDADLIYEAKDNWKKGESKLTREQYAALARKIRGSYKDYFKDYVVEDRVENTYYKPTASTGTVPYLPLLVGVVLAMLGTTVFVVSQTSGQ